MSIEKALVADLLGRVGSLKAQADVRELPGKVDTGPRGFTHAKAAVWIAYNGSVYERPGQLGGATQLRTLLFDAQVLVRDVGGPAAMTELVSAVRELLHGFRCSFGEPVHLVRDGYAAHKDGIWRHEIVFGIVGPCVPVEDPAPELPILSLITVDDADGNVQFTVPPGAP